VAVAFVIQDNVVGKMKMAIVIVLNAQVERPGLLCLFSVEYR
jgi:hypothetical protein